MDCRDAYDIWAVKIDTDGVVSNPQVGELKELQAAWQKGLQQDGKRCRKEGVWGILDGQILE